MANLACRTMCNSKPAILESSPQIFTQSDFNEPGEFHVELVHRLGGGMRVVSFPNPLAPGALTSRYMSVGEPD